MKRSRLRNVDRVMGEHGRVLDERDENDCGGKEREKKRKQ